MRQAPRAVSFLYHARRNPHDVHPLILIPHRVAHVRGLHFSNPLFQDDRSPLRKELKDAARSARLAPDTAFVQSPDTLVAWELTVGIEVHAQLNTSCKLFSRKAMLVLLFCIL